MMSGQSAIHLSYFYFCPRRSLHCDGYDECQLAAFPVACSKSPVAGPQSVQRSSYFFSGLIAVGWVRVEFSGLCAELVCLLLVLASLVAFVLSPWGHEGPEGP